MFKKVVEVEFFKLTGVLPLHPTNHLEDKVMRKDVIFDKLAEKIFDYPFLLDILLKKAKRWIIYNKSELTLVIIGYLYYFKGEFKKSSKFLLEAIKFNPINLDNWIDYAFSLYHQDIGKHVLAKKILFNLEKCIKYFKNKKVTFTNIRNFLRDK